MADFRSFEVLAVEAFARATREKEEADRRRKEAHQQRLDKAQADFTEAYLPDVQRAFAEHFGLDPHDPLVRDLDCEGVHLPVLLAAGRAISRTDYSRP
jgi:hypothetical protein